MEGIAFKEVLTCRPLDLTDVQRKPVPKAIMEAVKCCVCLKDSIGPVVPSRFCQDASHPICDSCFSAYRKVVGHPEPFKCPSLEEDGQICGSPIITIDRNPFGIPLHSDYLAKERSVFPCVAAALFECKFVGSNQEMVEHMKSNCIFRYLLLCNRIVNDDEGTTCNKMFETPKMLHEHQKKDHDFEFSYHSEFSVKLGFNDSKAGRRVGNKCV
ncbi:unnamed protein product [Orchesella dallaii]|uniref:RING-type E3 ubiquitin transferase n=1 Tax=Orchesella dallaii TaxID=48710 RepID=A0ABP1Q8Z7_9HEXA